MTRVKQVNFLKNGHQNKGWLLNCTINSDFGCKKPRELFEASVGLSHVLMAMYLYVYYEYE